ncbi:MAG: hypothetical protein IPL46_08170 [Saprospiraceae bacterium]|nr:hypothetical protein [Saprospiraceae bacterium]
MNTSIQKFNIVELNTRNASIQSLNHEITGHLNMAKLTPGTLKQVSIIKSFETLSPNWDSYDAEAPSFASISKAISFLLLELPFKVEPFFVAPTSDGDILIEFKQGNCTLELLLVNSKKKEICRPKQS